MEDYKCRNLMTAKNHLTEAYRHLLIFLRNEDESGAYDLKDVLKAHDTLKDVLILRESLKIKPITN